MLIVNDFDPPNSNKPATIPPPLCRWTGRPHTHAAGPTQQTGILLSQGNIALAAGIARQRSPGHHRAVSPPASNSAAPAQPTVTARPGHLAGGGDQGSTLVRPNEPAATPPARSATCPAQASTVHHEQSAPAFTAERVLIHRNTRMPPAAPPPRQPPATVTNGAGVLVLGTSTTRRSPPPQVTMSRRVKNTTPPASSDVTDFATRQKAPDKPWARSPRTTPRARAPSSPAPRPTRQWPPLCRRYPGGNRRPASAGLSSGDYEVHTIGTNLHTSSRTRAST